MRPDYFLHFHNGFSMGKVTLICCMDTDFDVMTKLSQILSYNSVKSVTVVKTDKLCCAALIATICWYRTAQKEDLKRGVLCWLYWGASLMWMIDAVFEYVEPQAEYFCPAPVDMLNDFFLGLSVVALGMIIWLVYLLLKDPKGVVKASIIKNKKK